MNNPYEDALIHEAGVKFKKLFYERTQYLRDELCRMYMRQRIMIEVEPDGEITTHYIWDKYDKEYCEQIKELIKTVKDNCLDDSGLGRFKL